MSKLTFDTRPATSSTATETEKAPASETETPKGDFPAWAMILGEKGGRLAATQDSNRAALLGEAREDYLGMVDREQADRTVRFLAGSFRWPRAAIVGALSLGDKAARCAREGGIAALAIFARVDDDTVTEIAGKARSFTAKAVRQSVEDAAKDVSKLREQRNPRDDASYLEEALGRLEKAVERVERLRAAMGPEGVVRVSAAAAKLAAIIP